MSEKKELKSSDLYFTPEEIKKAEENRVPPEYIQIKLSSVGKLGCPSIVHVRDYRFDEALKLAEIEEKNETEVIIQVVNAILFEDFDAGDLHRNDLIEILMSIQGTWYSPKLEDMPYLLNPELTGDELHSKENVGLASLPFSVLKTKPIAKEVKLPITISHKDTTIQFSVPKIKNEVIAAKLIDMKYAQEDNEISQIKRRIELETNTVEDLSTYEDYLKRRTNDYIKINQAMLFESFNGKKLETLEEKLEILPEVSLHIIGEYQKVLKKYFEFGVDPEVTFYSEELNESIIRRFDFRPIHFLSTLEPEDSSGFDVSFG